MRRKLLNGRMIGILAVLLVLFMAVGVAEEERTDAGEQWTHVELQTETFPTQLPDMNTEAGIREYLAGEWYSYDPSHLGLDACRMIIDEDLNTSFEFFSGFTNETKGHYSGHLSFDRIYADAHEVPDLLCLTLSDDCALLGGDFFFLHRTVFEGRCVM